jgi:hypothetical protein
MVDFRRKKDETVSEWAARLRREDVSRLTAGQLQQLTLRLVQAALALRRANTQPEQRPDAVLHCQKAVLQLSAKERQRLARWLEDGLAG